MNKLKDKRTELSKIGKINTIEMLYEGTDYKSGQTIQVLSSQEDSVRTSHKMLLEGIDFDLTYTPLMHLGYKAVLASLGDLYAAFHQPEAISINIGLSGKFYYEDIEKLWQGVLAAAKQHGINSLILDLNSSLTGLCVSVTSVGKQRSEILAGLNAPKEHDLICLSGDLGAAYMGLLVLEREKVAFNNQSNTPDKMKQPDLSAYKYILESYLSPYIKPDMIDQFISDGILPGYGYCLTKGLSAAIKELSRDSGLGARLYLEHIPISSKTIEAGEEFAIDAVTAAMNGGDDYKFIFTIPIEKHEEFRKEFQNWDVIGHLTKPDSGSLLVTPDGQTAEIKAQGWE